MLKRAILMFFASCTVSVFGLAGQSLASSSTLIGMVNGGDIYVKAGGTNTAWTSRLTTGESATQLKMYGTRVAFVDGGNNLFLKDGLNGAWVEEMSNVSSFALTETGLLVVQAGNNGDVWYKAGENPSGAWDSNLLATGGSKVYLSPSEMVIIENPGMLLGKALTAANATVSGFGPDSGWSLIANNATGAAVSDNMLVMLDNQGQSFVKLGGFTDGWVGNGSATAIDNRVTGVWTNAAGTVYCAQEHNGAANDSIDCKDAHSMLADEAQIFGGPGTTMNDFALGADVALAYGSLSGPGNNLYGADYVEAPNSQAFGGYTFNVGVWGTLSTAVTSIATNQQ